MFKITVQVNDIEKTSLNFMIKKLLKTINGASVGRLKKILHFGFPSNNNGVYLIHFNGYELDKKSIKMLSTIRNDLKTINFNIGFHIGQKKSAYLPENILLCSQINKINFDTINYTFTEYYQNGLNTNNNVNNNDGHIKQETYILDNGFD